MKAHGSRFQRQYSRLTDWSDERALLSLVRHSRRHCGVQPPSTPLAPPAENRNLKRHFGFPPELSLTEIRTGPEGDNDAGLFARRHLPRPRDLRLSVPQGKKPINKIRRRWGQNCNNLLPVSVSSWSDF
jgi:hypothetical protein